VCGDYEPPSPVVLVAMKHIQPRITRIFTINKINKPAHSLVCKTQGGKECTSSTATLCSNSSALDEL
jgi:hypothetical protein